MKVLLVNGSPNRRGNTFAALEIVRLELESKGVETEYFHVGTKPVRGCIACHKCEETSRCNFDDDPANSLIDAMLASDGVVIGTPVYFAGPNGLLCALLDRVFYAASNYGQQFAGKPAAALATCYRGGCTAALDRLNKYFTFSQMPIVSSNYWNMIIRPVTITEDGPGGAIEIEAPDQEGVAILRTLGKNMADMVLGKTQ